MGETRLNIGTITEIPPLGGSDLCILHSQEITGTNRFRPMSVVYILSKYI